MTIFVRLSLMTILIIGLLLAPGCVFDDGSQSSKELKAAVKRLKDDDPLERIKALEDLYALGMAGEIPDPGEVLPHVIERFDDKDPLVRAWAYSSALPVAGIDFGSFVLKLDYREEDIQEIHDKFPAIPVLMPHLINALNDESKIVRLAAAHTLSDLVPLSRDAVPGLIKVFADKGNDGDVDDQQDIPHFITTDLRRLALRTITRTGDVPETITPEVLDFLGSEDTSRRSAALQALKHIGPARGVVDAIIELIGNERDAGILNWAISVLGTFGPESVPAIPVLIELTDADIEMLLGINIRQGVINLLGRIGTYSDDAIPPLLELLKDDDPEVRRWVVGALGTIGAKPVVLEALVNALDDGDSRVRGLSARALGVYVDYSDVLIPRLEELKENDKDRSVRSQAGLAIDKLKGIHKFPTEPIEEIDLEKYKDDPEGLFKELVGRFGEGELLARQYAVNLLAEQFPEEAYPVLMNAITDEDPLIRAAVPVALGKIGKGKSQTLPVLVDALDDEDRDVCTAAAMGICLLREEAIDAVPKLLEMLLDEDEVVRGKVAEAFGYSGGIVPDAVIPALIAMFSDEEDFPRIAAESALIAYKEEVVPLLIENLVNEDRQVLFSALRALDQIVRVVAAEQKYPDIAEELGYFDPSMMITINLVVIVLQDRAFIEEAIPLIIELIGNADSETRFVAKEIGIRAAPEETSVKLIELLGDKNARCDAISFLRDLEPMPKDAIPVLIGIIRSGEFEGEEPDFPEMHFTEECVFALAEYGVDAIDAIEPLTGLLSSKHAGIRHAAAWALGEFGPDAASAVDLLIRALMDESPDVRYNTAVTLGKIGAKATSALPKMQEVAADEKNREVRNALQEAIHKILLAGAGLSEADEPGDVEGTA